MRCPKCQYLSFDSGDRCRNCGYEFALAVEEPSRPELPIQTGDEAIGPLSDFSLTDPDASAPRQRDASTTSADAPVKGRAPVAGLDLPLFTSPGDDDRPLVVPPAVPRPPLAVRRSAPVAGRAGGAPDDPVLDLGPLPRGHARHRHEGTGTASSAAEPAIADAGSGARLLAMLIDAGLLLAIDAIVVYLTLRICGFTLQEIRLLPPVPLGGFLLMLHGSYMVIFTAAGGQTVGKMATHIRVVPADAQAATDRVPVGIALTRAAASIVTVLTAGIGYLPALMGTRRAVHDRLADTRVVRA